MSLEQNPEKLTTDSKNIILEFKKHTETRPSINFKVETIDIDQLEKIRKSIRFEEPEITTFPIIKSRSIHIKNIGPGKKVKEEIVDKLTNEMNLIKSAHIKVLEELYQKNLLLYDLSDKMITIEKESDHKKEEYEHEIRFLRKRIYNYEKEFLNNDMKAKEKLNKRIEIFKNLIPTIAITNIENDESLDKEILFEIESELKTLQEIKNDYENKLNNINEKYQSHVACLEKEIQTLSEINNSSKEYNDELNKENDKSDKENIEDLKNEITALTMKFQEESRIKRNSEFRLGNDISQLNDLLKNQAKTINDNLLQISNLIEENKKLSKNLKDLNLNYSEIANKLIEKENENKKLKEDSEIILNKIKKITDERETIISDYNRFVTDLSNWQDVLQENYSKDINNLYIQNSKLVSIIDSHKNFILRREGKKQTTEINELLAEDFTKTESEFTLKENKISLEDILDNDNESVIMNKFSEAKSTIDPNDAKSMMDYNIDSENKEQIVSLKLKLKEYEGLNDFYKQLEEKNVSLQVEIESLKKKIEEYSNINLNNDNPLYEALSKRHKQRNSQYIKKTTVFDENRGDVNNKRLSELEEKSRIDDENIKLLNAQIAEMEMERIKLQGDFNNILFVKERDEKNLKKQIAKLESYLNQFKMLYK